jgi:2,4-dienoyl-CoA reductase-like NADH-dependent reductase (Old Yellow Enzyme family)
VAAILSSFVPVAPRGRIMPNYATIDSDDRVPFWRELGKRVHDQDCKFILQLSHAGRQRDIPGIEFAAGLSSTKRPDPLHGFQCERMTKQDIQETVQAFAAGARQPARPDWTAWNSTGPTAISLRNSLAPPSTTVRTTTVVRSPSVRVSFWRS